MVKSTKVTSKSASSNVADNPLTYDAANKRKRGRNDDESSSVQDPAEVEVINHSGNSVLINKERVDVATPVTQPNNHDNNNVFNEMRAYMDKFTQRFNDIESRVQEMFRKTKLQVKFSIQIKKIV